MSEHTTFTAIPKDAFLVVDDQSSLRNTTTAIGCVGELTADSHHIYPLPTTY